MNTTSASLAEAILRWPNLVFLDFSNTLAVRDRSLLSNIQYLPALQVLKLRHVNLRDEDIDVLADAVGIRVRSLDIRENQITDRSVRTLLNTCFKVADDGDVPSSITGSPTVVVEDDWPSGVPRPDSNLLNEFRGEDLDERYVNRLTKGVISRLPTEDLPNSGLTHLYVADNYLTVEGISSLIKSRKLHVLDAGAVDTIRSLSRPRVSSSPNGWTENPVPLLGFQKLIPSLEVYGHRNLTFLRVHHAVVTQTVVVKDDSRYRAELSAEDTANIELDVSKPVRQLDSRSTCRLDAVPPAYEKDERELTPRFELPGDSLYLRVSPAVGDKPSPTIEEQKLHDVRRGSIFAPECIMQDDKEDDPPAILTATGLENITRAIHGVHGLANDAGIGSIEELSEAGASMDSKATINGYNHDCGDTPLITTVRGLGDITQMTDVRNSQSNNSSEASVINHSSVLNTASSNPELSIAIIEGQRDDLRSRRIDMKRGLVPGALPNLRTLVLTDIPWADPDQHIIDALIKLIKDAAEETKLAELQATLERHSLYVPRKPRSLHHQYRVRELFALERIVLEMAPPSSIPMSEVPYPPHSPPSSRWSNRYSKSSTEDADSEAFWSAQENDFSFFGDEECGLPDIEPGMHFPLSTLSEKMVMSTDDIQTESVALPPTLQQPRRSESANIDVVQELVKFRKERKATFENLRAMGEKFVEGHWPGEVKVVRHRSPNVKVNGSVDCYGNYFEKGVYR